MFCIEPLNAVILLEMTVSQTHHSYGTWLALKGRHCYIKVKLTHSTISFQIILSTVIFSFADLDRFEISSVGEIPSGWVLLAASHGLAWTTLTCLKIGGGGSLIPVTFPSCWVRPMNLGPFPCTLPLNYLTLSLAQGGKSRTLVLWYSPHGRKGLGLVPNGQSRVLA